MAGTKFKDYCKGNGIRQADIAKLLNLKSVNKKMNGKEAFTLPQIKTLCQNYHISADVYFM